MIHYGVDYHRFGPPNEDTSWSWGHWAVWAATSSNGASHTPIIRRFGARGARFDRRNAAGWAPVHDVFRAEMYLGNISPIFETLQALVDVGADITATTSKTGETILHLFAMVPFIEEDMPLGGRMPISLLRAR